MALASNLGYPRIGPDRGLKRVTESYWKGELTAPELLRAGSQLRRQAWEAQRRIGIDLVPCNDFSLYDHVLDAMALVGAVPARYGWQGGSVDLETYFAMARGVQREGLDVAAMEMTKWFDTNYHYIVPEFAAGQSFSLSSSKVFDELAEAREADVNAKPVLLGPVSLILLGKTREPEFRPLAELLDPLTEVYGQVIARLAGSGAEWIQLDEP
ncbi:MAG: 5-methyltetrahydropteroyltriglutamate--homocysteine S-methyltransferase, partial [Gemmatimonadota bacterium]